MKLYGHPVSPRYRRVAIAAAELGVALDLAVLDVRGGETRSPAYLAKNPMGKMPTFEDDDGWTLWESCAILVYLAERHPSHLFPVAPRGRADALRWMFWSVGHLDPQVEVLYAQRFLAPRRGQPTDETAVEAATKQIARYLPVLESRLAVSRYVLGDAFTLVDVALGIGVHTLFLPELGLDRKPWPAIADWHARLAARRSWAVGT